MAPQRLVQYVAGSKNKLPSVYLQCRVKAGASKVREGITALTSDAVELCVSAPARDGEANKAVVAVLSKALGIPKSNLQITRGLASKEKTVAVDGAAVQSGEDVVDALLAKLNEAAGNSAA